MSIDRVIAGVNGIVVRESDLDENGTCRTSIGAVVTYRDGVASVDLSGCGPSCTVTTLPRGVYSHSPLTENEQWPS